MGGIRRNRREVDTSGADAAAARTTRPEADAAGAADTEDAFTGDARRTGRRVLVVEDDADVAAVVADVLADAGYEVVITDTAVGAMALVRHTQPCAIVLDLGLPYRSGAKLLEDLKRTSSTAGIGVVVVSALAGELPPSVASLAAAVMPKPFDVQALWDAVRAACG